MTNEERGAALAVWELLLRTVTALTRTFDEEMQAGIGLDLTWFDVLIQLYEAPGERLRMQRLAELVMLSRSGLTRLVDRLERAGLVRRELAATDRRGLYAALTDEGRVICERAHALHHVGVEQHFSGHLTSKDIEALRAALTKVRDANVRPPVVS